MAGRPELHLALPIGYGLPPSRLVSLVGSAEAAGLDGVTCGEFADSDAFSVLAAAALVTSRVRLMTSVVSTLSRSPALLAMAASTVADLAGGRFTRGLGAGSPIVAGYHGKVFADPVGRMEATVADVRTALSGERVNSSGKFRLRRRTEHEVRLLVAAMNPRMLRLAGRSADGVILNLSGPRQVAAQRAAALAERDAARSGERWEVIVPLWVDAGRDEQRARMRFQSDMAPYMAVPTYRQAMVALSDGPAVDRGAQLWRDQGRSAATAAFPSSIVDAVLVTDEASLRTRLADLHDAGATGVLMTPLMHDATTTAGADAGVH